MSMSFFQWAVIIGLGLLVFGVASIGQVLDSIRDEVKEIAAYLADRDTNEGV